MRNVQVQYHREDGSWWADSQDVDGFYAVGASFDETRALAQEGLAFYLDGEAVRVVEKFENGAAVDVASAVSVPAKGWWTEAFAHGFGLAQTFGGPGVRVTSAEPTVAA